MQTGEAKILEEKTGIKLSDWLSARDDDKGMVELRCVMKQEQAVLLDRILFHTDYTDLGQVEETVYQFGRSLSSRDRLGRAFFVCLAAVIHSVGNVPVSDSSRQHIMQLDQVG